jgi:hypothetical protein
MFRKNAPLERRGSTPVRSSNDFSWGAMRGARRSTAYQLSAARRVRLLLDMYEGEKSAPPVPATRDAETPLAARGEGFFRNWKGYC